MTEKCVPSVIQWKYSQPVTDMYCMNKKYSRRLGRVDMFSAVVLATSKGRFRVTKAIFHKKF